ncbi:MAG: DUF2207 domain-containing protein [Acidobacteriia bacterium]|nr:DUF2207 domain-containing protein [Terriglobia bacterium]
MESLSRRKSLSVVGWILAFCFFSPALAAQTERIHSFDSQITVQTDGVLQVRETITVEAAGVEIKHGIYRDFPTRYKDMLGNARAVGFKLAGVERDGRPEPFHTGDLENGIRVYIGDRKKELSPGIYTYVLRYETNRQLGFFKDHDELYWNVTGLSWKFPIDVATATVLLPPKVRASSPALEGYTGPAGAKGQDYTAARDEQGNPVFRAENLSAYEGLTIVVSWPKGLIAEPDSRQRLSWFVQDNRALIVGLIGLAAVLLYYFLVWTAVGRDPRPGTIMPLYEPPADISPAAMRYLQQMEFDDRMLTADILDLAAKGYATIDCDKSDHYSAIRKPDSRKTEGRLLPDERTLARKLFESGDRVRFEQKNYKLISAARDALRIGLKNAMEKVYFVTNIRYLWPGIALTALSVVALMLVDAFHNGPLVLFLSVWLSGWSVGVSLFLKTVFNAWRDVVVEGFFKHLNFMAVFYTIFALPFVAAEVFVLVMLYKNAGLPTFLVMAATIGSNTLFHHLLRAPTRAGRQVLDRIEGFRMFLSAVEGPRLSTVTPPARTPELFERYLPHALALGVEQKWAEQFSEVLKRARQAGGDGRGYSPSWYSGAGLGALSAGAFASSFGSSFSSAISSSSTAPGSSSGSGGGSSGGGGGGGGGGGW